MPYPLDMDLILEQTFKSVRQGKMYRRLRVFVQWPRIAGEANARMSRPTALRGGVLTVTSEDPVWTDKAKYLESELIQRIAELVGEGIVKRIRFVTGQLSARPAPPPPARREITDDERRRIDDLLSGAELADKPELQEQLRSLFTLSLERGRPGSRAARGDRS